MQANVLYNRVREDFYLSTGRRVAKEGRVK